MFRLTTHSLRPTMFDVELHDGREGILVNCMVERGDVKKIVWMLQIFAPGTESVHFQQDFDTFLAALDFAIGIKPKEGSTLASITGKRYGEA